MKKVILYSAFLLSAVMSGCEKDDDVEPRGSGVGQALFYTSEDHGCGYITVTINGIDGFVTQYYSSSVPECGSNGCATFNLAEGSYSWSAKCNGYTWGPSTIYVTEDDCSKMRLK